MPGDIYVSTCCDVNEIDRVTPNGSVSVFVNSGASQLYDPAFDAAGNLFVVNPGNNTIEKFTPNGVGTVFASTGLNNPGWGLAFDPAGNLFASLRNNTIEKFTSNGLGTVFASTGLNGPQGLAFDASGNLFVANSGDNSIEKFTPSGIASVFASSVFSDPMFNIPSVLAFDAGGNLFVGDFVSTIVRFTPSGMESPFATVPAEVEGLAFDNVGNLLVADGGGGSVLAFSLNGDQQTIATGLPVVTGLAIEPAVSAVPEPATALILTTAVVGLGLTRRKQRPCR
jgi:sugar lactone lactonase YvrE